VPLLFLGDSRFHQYDLEFKSKTKTGWLKWITDRLLSSSLIAGLSFLLIVSFMVNGVLLAVNDWLKNYFPNVILSF
jgi:membrane protein